MVHLLPEHNTANLIEMGSTKPQRFPASSDHTSIKQQNIPKIASDYNSNRPNAHVRNRAKRADPAAPRPNIIAQNTATRCEKEATHATGLEIGSSPWLGGGGEAAAAATTAAAAAARMRRGEDRNAGDPGGGERIGLGRGEAGWLAGCLAATATLRVPF